MQLPVNELFPTLQGEAHWTGTPATFVRLQSCPIGCPWCDTKHTWSLNPADQIRGVEMMAKEKDAPTYAMVDAEDLVQLVEQNQSKHVVFTGGEPCTYDLTEVTERLLKKGYRSQIETSGTFPVRCTYLTWVTVSPKVDMPGGYKLLPSAIERANEIKMPVGRPADIDKLRGVLAMREVSCEVWLQPLSTSPKATALCIEEARKNDWRVSIQTHKFIGVR
jgi:7-carboxy-7-deazaguanine synthase